MGRITDWQYPPGATPLDLDEANGLIPQHITTQGQLNEWEQANILEAEKWINRQRSFDQMKIFSIDFIKKLHQMMFNKTWSWAGKFRQTNKNIGVDWVSIAIDLKVLLDDASYQLKNDAYPLDELATRFHHRLVSIHPFSNGNGRHARMMTDIVLLSQNSDRFSWGSKAKSLVEPSALREQYINALRAADKMNYTLLLDFVKK